MATPPAPRDQRPGCLTAVALFLFFGAVVWVFLALFDKGTRGAWYPIHLVVQAIAAGVAAAGLWRMRRWGAYVLTSLFVAIHIFYAFTGLLNMETFVIYLGMVAPTLYFYSRMK
ncbi:MAG TPA: hypothetical protein VK575_11110 [Gemmatimonadaceae bacterium]|nr:hypothetical protein [Gemmatimonadaceae bacterium]